MPRKCTILITFNNNNKFRGPTPAGPAHRVGRGHPTPLPKNWLAATRCRLLPVAFWTLAAVQTDGQTFSAATARLYPGDVHFVRGVRRPLHAMSVSQQLKQLLDRNRRIRIATQREYFPQQYAVRPTTCIYRTHTDRHADFTRTSIRKSRST